MHTTQILITFLATAIYAVQGQAAQANAVNQQNKQVVQNQGVVVGQTPKVDNEDVPAECRAICQPVIQLSHRCANQFGSSDDDWNNNNVQQGRQGTRDCVCNDPNARQALTTCGQCAQQYPQFFQNRDDDDGRVGVNDNKVHQWLRTCNFQQGAQPGTHVVYAPQNTPQQTGYKTTEDIDDDDVNNRNNGNIRVRGAAPSVKPMSYMAAAGGLLLAALVL